MEQAEWMKDLMEQAKKDPLYQSCLDDVKRLEPGFLALRDALREDRRNVLDAYLSACEELDHTLLLLAEQMTRQRCREEWASLLRLDALYREFYRDLETRGRRVPERTPEYLAWCRDYNDTARRVMEDTGVEIPLIDPEKI